MIEFLLWLVINGIAVYVTAALLPGVSLRGFGSAILAGLVLALVNALLRPVLIVLTLPLTIITLGLFILVINALLVMLVAALLEGFYVRGFWWALLFSVVLALLNIALFSAFGVRA